MIMEMKEQRKYSRKNSNSHCNTVMAFVILLFRPIGESDCSSTEDVKGDYPENGIKEIPDPVKHHPDAQERRKAVTSAIAFVLALLFHTSLEGFAFGVQKTVVSMSSLFFGVITHKALVAFSVGINFAKSLKHNQTLAVFLIILVASFSPIGGVIGIVVQVLFIESHYCRTLFRTLQWMR